MPLLSQFRIPTFLSATSWVVLAQLVAACSGEDTDSTTTIGSASASGTDATMSANSVVSPPTAEQSAPVSASTGTPPGVGVPTPVTTGGPVGTVGNPTNSVPPTPPVPGPSGSPSGSSGTGNVPMGGSSNLGTGGEDGAGGSNLGAGGQASGGAGASAGDSANSGGIDGLGGSNAGDGGEASGGSSGSDPGMNSGELIGFATLNGGTSGGEGGETVTASTYADLKSYAESATPYIIRVEGTISNGANGGQIRVSSNKSIIGVGSTAFLNGVGIDINNSNNIILQNLRVSMTGVTTRTDTAGVYSSTGDGGLPQVLVNGGDAISISGTSKNVWIDHCELFSEDPSVQTNKDLFDGLIDIKGQTGFITISWCYLHDHHKGGLVGASDSDLFDDRKITLHHNYYDNIKLRVPMYRGSTGHFFNNYVVGATDASEIRAGTCLRVERNYYEALHYSIYTTSDSAGSTERIENVEVSRTERAYPNDCTADIPYPYADALTTTTEDVKTIVPEFAGVGKL